MDCLNKNSSLRWHRCTGFDVTVLQDIAIETFKDAYEHLNTMDNFNSYLEEAFSLEKLQSELTNPLSAFFFLFVNEILVGYFKVNENEAQTDIKDALSLELERIYIKREYQGQGFGKILIHKAIDLANLKDKDYIWLGVWEKNTRAVKFYKSCGFQKTNTHIFVMGDESQTDFIMKKYLK